MTQIAPPPTLADDLRRVTQLELSLPSRLRYVALLLLASTMTAIVSALLLTEPALPPRTSLALAALALMGCSWIGFASWVLTSKRILLGYHRVVASRFAVGFSAAFVLGASVVGYITSQISGLVAAGTGIVMLIVAIVMHVRARRTFVALSRRRDELERQLGWSRR